MPSPRKPSNKRQGHTTKDTVVELDVLAGGLEVPDPPEHWLPSTVAEWEGFWSDEELISVVRPSHRPALVRLFELRDRQALQWKLAQALREEVGEEHFTAGSTGQVKANPLYERAEKAEALALQIEGRIEALEDRFGLTPGSLLKLGVDFQRKQNLEAMNVRMMEALGRVTAGSSGAHDPRALPGDPAVGAS